MNIPNLTWRGDSIEAMKRVRHMAAQVLMGLGSICILVPFYSLMHSEFRWRTAIVAVVVGVVLLSGGVVLLKPPRPRVRPRYWAPAVAGGICSVCTLLFSIGCVIIYRTTAENAPDWLLLVMVLVSVIGILAAITCIATGVITATRAEPKTSDEKIAAICIK